MAAHVLLAPATADWLSTREFAKVVALKAMAAKKEEEQRNKQFTEFKRLLHAHPPTPKTDVIEAAVSLRNWLRPAGKELTIVLLPMRHALLNDHILARKAGFAARMMVSTEQALKAENINVINLLPDVYQAYQRGGDPDVFADAAGHYSESICEKTVDLLKAKPDAYFVGDCFAFLYSRAHEKVNQSKVRYSFVNATTNLAPLNLSSYGMEELSDLNHVFWFITDSYLINQKKFAPCVQRSGTLKEQGTSSAVATLMKKSVGSPGTELEFAL